MPPRRAFRSKIHQLNSVKTLDIVEQIALAVSVLPLEYAARFDPVIAPGIGAPSGELSKINDVDVSRIETPDRTFADTTMQGLHLKAR
jgi:hypothetical protein